MNYVWKDLEAQIESVTVQDHRMRTSGKRWRRESDRADEKRRDRVHVVREQVLSVHEVQKKKQEVAGEETKYFELQELGRRNRWVTSIM